MPKHYILVLSALLFLAVGFHGSSRGQKTTEIGRATLSIDATVPKLAPLFVLNQGKGTDFDVDLTSDYAEITCPISLEMRNATGTLEIARAGSDDLRLPDLDLALDGAANQRLLKGGVVILGVFDTLSPHGTTVSKIDKALTIRAASTKGHKKLLPGETLSEILTVTVAAR